MVAMIVYRASMRVRSFKRMTRYNQCCVEAVDWRSSEQEEWKQTGRRDITARNGCLPGSGHSASVHGRDGEQAWAVERRALRQAQSCRQSSCGSKLVMQRSRRPLSR